MHHSEDWAQTCYVGDPPSKCDIVLISEATSAGDLKDSKYTSGGALCLVGSNLFESISWLLPKLKTQLWLRSRPIETMLSMRMLS